MTATEDVDFRATPAQSARRPRHPSGPQLLAMGMLLLQLAWVFVVPPFRGSDEFDHVYKAAAVARGEWAPPPGSATRGTGAWLDVPPDIVKAAAPQCRALPYTHDEDCAGTRRGDTVRIASGAGRYNPVFYAVVGIPALPFSGYDALYVMRLMTVLVSWLFFCGAIAATRLWARSCWPYVGLAVASTPVLVYSGSVVAPNGVEMTAAMMFWASLIGICRGGSRLTSDGRAVDRRLLTLAGISGSTLVMTRSLGPVWCLLTALTVMAAYWPTRERWVALRRQRSAWVASGGVLVAALVSTWWILRMGSLKLSTDARPRAAESLEARFRIALHDVPLSALQSIAAFPFRNQPTQPVVYACYVILIVGALVIALRAASARFKVVIVATCLVSVIAPVLIQVATYNEFGPVWQGRYALPYSLGTALVAAAVLDSKKSARLEPPLAFAGLLLFGIAQVVGPVDVLRQESDSSPLAGTTAWIEPSVYVVAVAASVGAMLLWSGATRARRTEPVT